MGTAACNDNVFDKTQSTVGYHEGPHNGTDPFSARTYHDDHHKEFTPLKDVLG